LLDSGPFDGALTELALTGLQPNHGPFVGGTTVLLRGRGFRPDSTVRFGGLEVDGTQVQLIDDNRLQVVTPPHPPGVVTINVRTADGAEALLDEAFAYDSWYVDPPSGSVSGGTLVRLLGTGGPFPSSLEVTFGGSPATEVSWLSADEVTCQTPPGRSGTVDVTWRGEQDQARLIDGFSYFDRADPLNGGFGGGPLDGSLDVVVLDATTRMPLADAFVIVGSDGSTPFQGRTDATGRIAFFATAERSLEGRQELTVSHAPVDVFNDQGELVGQTLYESTTLVSFDALSVTVLLRSIPPPDLGGLTPPPGRQGGAVEGELLFEHSGEFGLYEWDIIPRPQEGERKVAFVYVAQGNLSFHHGPRARASALEEATYLGEEGYRFRFSASPGALTVYAVAGLGRVVDDQVTPIQVEDFVPYVMGMKRGVIVEPGVTTSGVKLLMTQQLASTITVDLVDYPAPDAARGPNLYRVDLALSLGADGHILLSSSQRSVNPTGSFRFVGWPEVAGPLAGATYTIRAGAWTVRHGGVEENPWSIVYRRGVTDVSSPIVIDEFLAVPRARVPQPGAAVGPERHMEWDSWGGATPSFTTVSLLEPTGIMPRPYWFVVLRGGVNAYDLPDVTTLAEAPPPPQGNVVWQVESVTVPGFDFDSWSYRYLDSRYWSAYATDTWYVLLAP
jgi:hypothetical protein